MSPEEIRAGIVDRLRSRRDEIEKAIFARTRRVAHYTVPADVQHHFNQSSAVSALVGYALAGLEDGKELVTAVPSEALALVRVSTLGGIDLGTILASCAAGYAEFGEFVMEEAGHAGILAHDVTLRSIHRAQVSLLGRLLATISNEHMRGLHLERTPQQRLAQLVHQLLRGEGVNLPEVPYDLGGWHLGVVGTGVGVEDALDGLATGATCECKWLCIPSDDPYGVWGWFGGHRDQLLRHINRLKAADWSKRMAIAVGQPAQGLDGWRRTHRQAQDAFLVSVYDSDSRPVTLYTDIALLAPWLRDEPNARDLVNTYLSPLDKHRCASPTLRETLRCYLAAGRNASAAARILNISRRTMRNRMTLIEDSLKGQLFDNSAELELALRLDRLLEN